MPTDIAGYRAESDAPPADVTLASVLTNKAPLLNTPGSDVAEPLYYGKSNSSVNAAESQFYFGKDRIDFQGTKSLTQQQNVYIPNRYFAGNTFLNVQLNGAALTWDAVPAQQVGIAQQTRYFCMEQGWGFSIIGRLMYYLGASNVVNVSISGETNLALALAPCETREKRMQMLESAGKWLFTNPTVGMDSGFSSGLARPAAGQLLFRNAANVLDDADGAIIANVADPRFLHALVPLRLPWSSTCAMQGRLPFDTNLLNQPINVQIEFRRPPVRTVDNFFVGGNAFATLTDSANELNIQYEQTELIDKSLSLRTELLQHPDFNVGLPFQFLQSMPFQAKYRQFENDDALFTTPQKFNITSMINADLTTLLLQVQEPVNAAEYGNKADFVELNDIILELNGQQFCVFQKDNYYGMNAARQIGAVSLKHPVLTRTATLATAQQGFVNAGPLCIMKDIGIYEINMSRLRALANESHLVNVPRFTNQTFQITFSIPPSVASKCSLAVLAPLVDEITYTAHLTYLYNGVFQIGGSGGASKLFT